MTQSVDKKFFVLNKGVNTEAPLVQWPEGFTIDEQNFDLLQDGSRRRRKGLGIEEGAVQDQFGIAGSSTDESNTTYWYRWKNVANTDTVNYIVLQAGTSLHIFNEPKSGAIGNYIHTVDLSEFKVSWQDSVTGESFTASTPQLSTMQVSMAEANGVLIVVGTYIDPFTIKYTPTGFTTSRIEVKERDLFGVEDGLENDVMPTVLTTEHEYNLFSRGWISDNITAFYADQSAYPSKNMIHYMGMRRQTDVGYADEDGVKAFSPDKLVNELFQNMTAPQGHITRNVFDWRTGYGSLGQADIVKQIASAVAYPATSRVEITSADPAHGVVANTKVEVSGLTLRFRNPNTGATKWITLDGEYPIVLVNDSNTFTIGISSVVVPTHWVFKETGELGTYSLNGNITADFEGFEPSSSRFTCCAAFAGRVFYGGCPDQRLSERLYFSKVVEQPRDIGQCFQEADPTSEFISDLLPTDGGYVTIPNLGTLRALLPYGNSLLCFSSEGVWRVGPGSEGLFSALGYSVEKITSAGCVSARSVVLGDNIPMYWANSGIFALVQDANSGFLTADNISQKVINSLYSTIRATEKSRVKAGYDPIRNRVIWLYNNRFTTQPTGDLPRQIDNALLPTSVTPVGELDDGDIPQIVYNAALIFDLNHGAFLTWTFANTAFDIRDIVSLSFNYATTTENGSLRFFMQIPGSTNHSWGELNDGIYQDLNVPTKAYIISGPDSLNEPERFKYAPYVHVFMRKEPGEQFVVAQTPVSGTPLDFQSFVDVTVDNMPQSVFMQPRWDWARGTDSGKVGKYVQVYREVKPNIDEFGLVVTKNKVLGRGRNLFLAFKADENSPCWLDGWTVKYDAQVII